MSQVKNLVDAIDTFIVGCKSDGIWDAIKACCILAGWDGLNGCLVPLKGTAPTNNSFVSGDYSRTGGLTGNGSTKYLNSNRTNGADPQDSNHNAVYATSIAATNGTFIASDGLITTGTNFMAGSQSDVVFTRSRSSTGTPLAIVPQIGLIGHSRSSSGGYVVRSNGANNNILVASNGVENSLVLLYRRNNVPSPIYSSHSIAFYSIGEALDLALLDTRVTNLITSIGAAIP